jgi:hypothetical protein
MELNWEARRPELVIGVNFAAGVFSIETVVIWDPSLARGQLPVCFVALLVLNE